MSVESTTRRALADRLRNRETPADRARRSRQAQGLSPYASDSQLAEIARLMVANPPPVTNNKEKT